MIRINAAQLQFVSHAFTNAFVVCCALLQSKKILKEKKSVQDNYCMMN
jgi:hypothetical protein